MARAQSSAARKTKPDDKVFYGYRDQKVILPDGSETYEEVPLREEDLLYPQEGDFVVANDYHNLDAHYIANTLRIQSKDRRGFRVFGDHIIDFQHGDVQPLRPDVILVKGEPFEWDGSRGTFPVKDMKTEVVFVIEITSPATRRKDLGEKFDLYYRASVPLYVIIDAPYAGRRKPRGVLPYRAGSEAFELLPLNIDGRFWLDAVDISIGIVDGRVACFDAAGKRIDDPLSMHATLIAEKARAEEEKSRADVEKVRAEEEKARADVEKVRAEEEKARAEEEKTRAEAAEARIRELEAQIAKPKRRKK